ncbi:unnamed protein product [Cuscuta epithymum]|uniref:C3H1-type domain-containing protein n=1 Tax=Cuscuta epithymum TaxID=186058 RepID=A0AAV0DKJ1_9ASTE|nr:unnamed protein product [Cuscuta epithymum]
MMIGEKYHADRQAPAYPFPDVLTVDVHSSLNPAGSGNGHDDFSFPQNDAALQSLIRYLPSQSNDVSVGSETDKDVDLPVGAYTCDNFRMYDFKVRRCARGGSHDWTECPYAHPGEKARRRDPRKYHYAGVACPEFRKGSCRKGDACEYAHGVFECWLHPARYRTQPCKDGLNCNRRVCFFAHAPVQLRVLSPRAVDWGSSSSDSPPTSPVVTAAFRQLPSFGSPKSGIWSLPATPTRTIGRPGMTSFDLWEGEEDLGKEDAPMERVESGRDIRAKMLEKIGKENPLDGQDPNSDPYPAQFDAPNPDVGWVSELVQ